MYGSRPVLALVLCLWICFVLSLLCCGVAFTGGVWLLVIGPGICFGLLQRVLWSRKLVPAAQLVSTSLSSRLSGSVAGGVSLPPPPSNLCLFRESCGSPFSAVTAWILEYVVFNLYVMACYDFSAMVLWEKRRSRRQHGTICKYPDDSILFRLLWSFPALGAGVCCCCFPLGLQDLRCLSVDPTPFTSTMVLVYGFYSHQNVDTCLVRGLFRFYIYFGLLLWFCALHLGGSVLLLLVVLLVLEMPSSALGLLQRVVWSLSRLTCTRPSSSASSLLVITSFW